MSPAARGAAVLILLLSLTCCQSAAKDAPLSPPGDGGEFCQERIPRDGLLAFGAGEVTNRANFDVTVTKVELVDPVGMELVGARTLYVPEKGPSLAMGVLSGWPPDFTGYDDLEARFREAGETEGSTMTPTTTMMASFAIGVRAEPGGRSGPLRLTYRSGDDEWTWTGTITFRAGDGTSC